MRFEPTPCGQQHDFRLSPHDQTAPYMYMTTKQNIHFPGALNWIRTRIFAMPILSYPSWLNPQDLDEHGMRPTEDNIEAIKNMQHPQTVKDVRSCLGSVNFYGKFIPNVANIRKPLNDLLKKDHKFIWTKECEDAFNKLRLYLTSEPLLVRPNYTDTFVITTDTSNYAIGAVLSNGKTTEHPIAHASRALTGAEIRYHTIEKGLLVILYGQ